MNLSDKIKAKIESGREYRKVYDAFQAAGDDGKIVEGYATTYNEPYTLFCEDEYTVREQISPNAFDNADMSDVIFQYDHEGRVFARMSNNTLVIASDTHGLKIKADLGGTEIGRQLYEEIKGGYTNKMSFGFTVASDEFTETHNEDGTTDILRTITGIKKLYDVSAVSLPANDATEISARNLADGVIEKVREEIAQAEAEMRKKEITRKLIEIEMEVL